MRKSFTIWDHFFPFLVPRDSKYLKSLDIGLREVRAKRRLNKVNKWKNPKKKLFFCRGDFTPLMSKCFHIWDHFFALLFPKDSKYLKSLEIELREVGKKRPLNGVRKCDGQTHTRTFWLIESNGPELFVSHGGDSSGMKECRNVGI